jgi:hypothetical protein
MCLSREAAQRKGEITDSLLLLHELVHTKVDALPPVLTFIIIKYFSELVFNYVQVATAFEVVVQFL